MRPAPRANRSEWNTRRDHISRTSRGPHTQSSMWPPATRCSVPPVSNGLLDIPTSSTDRSLSGRPPFSTRARRRTPTKPIPGRSSRKTRSRSSTRRRRRFERSWSGVGVPERTRSLVAQTAWNGRPANRARDVAVVLRTCRRQIVSNSRYIVPGRRRWYRDLDAAGYSRDAPWISGQTPSGNRR